MPLSTRMRWCLVWLQTQLSSIPSSSAFRGSFSEPVTQQVSSFGPMKSTSLLYCTNIFVLVHQTSTGFHCHSNWSSRKRGWKMIISLPGGNFLFVDLLVWIRKSIIPTPTFTQKAVARKSELEFFALVWDYPKKFMLYEEDGVCKLTEGKGRGETEWKLMFGNYSLFFFSSYNTRINWDRHLCVHPLPTLKKIFQGNQKQDVYTVSKILITKGFFCCSFSFYHVFY